MNNSKYWQARDFIYTDIQREINLAKISDTKEGKENLEKLVGFSGGSNFMAALALLCYTEFAGMIKYNKKKPYPSANFNSFFDDLGEEYKKFREKEHNVYNVFRCGLAHEYYVKKNCIISMLSRKGTGGIGIKNGRYYFCVEKYFKDFQKAFDAFGSKFVKGDPVRLAGGATTLSVQRY